MMTNLFSTFDPATTINMSMNWLSTFLGLIMIPSSFWLIQSRFSSLIKLIYKKLHQEFKMLLGPNTMGFSIMFISLFAFILTNNMMGLLPYVFTSSSHLTYTLSLAIPMWLSLMIFGWTNHSQHMFSHLIPEGSPPLLMPFMVCIETISNIIRPGSLAVRLTANMIAGHLLMCLLGNNIYNSKELIIPALMLIQIMLMLFELAVSIIQAYVFSVLSTLYTSEVAYEKA
uniref:ATP synthase subunit a n=1 Tax=Acanthaspis ruficeps TaxID=1524498 RepID=A0A343IS91_9HEMI|nr:ATP synthase F0 subunit 6 [Acanthaspis ruficeps]AST10090.1 ATP synthase F0 subunit 6 [Acanthaspis ruficeps]